MSTHEKRTLNGLTLSSRRDVLRALGLAGGAVLLAPRGSSVAYAAAQGYAAGMLALEIDNVSLPLESAEGGNAFADVGLEPPTDSVMRKHLTGIRYEEIVIQAPLAAPGLVGWINSTLAKGPAPKSGAIVYGDYNYKEVKRLEFLNAVITEVSFPACEMVAAKSAAYLTLRLAAESTRLTGGSGQTMKGYQSPKAVNVSSAVFRMNVQGLEGACSKIRKITAPSAKRVQGKPSGLEVREKVPASQLDCSAISVTLPEKDAGPFFSWFNDFALHGNANAELAGRLEYLVPDASRAVAQIDFGNLGIVRYAPLPPSESTGSAGAAGALAMVQVDMFCESLSFAVV